MTRLFIRYWYLPILFLLVVSVFLLRVVPVYSQVFFPDHFVNFTTNDAWWHMRIIDNLVANFPHLNQVDPYQSLPSTPGLVESMDRVHLFDWFIAGIAWVAGLGHPSQFLVDSVAAFVPPALGALTLIPVYVIGAVLFAPWVGLFSAAFIAVLPGGFLGRSTLGSTDTHVAESLLLATVICLLILALRYAFPTVNKQMVVSIKQTVPIKRAASRKHQ